MQAWYALYTKPHKEPSVEQLLALKGLSTYLPMLPKVRGGRRLQTLEPLFPCYLFVRADLDVIGFSTIRWTPGLRNVVTGADGPAIVDEALIDHIQLRLAQKEFVHSAAHDLFKQGERVRVKGFPFDQFDAVFEGYLPGAARARVLLYILGQQTPVEIAVERLQKASPLRPAR